MTRSALFAVAAAGLLAFAACGDDGGTPATDTSATLDTLGGSDTLVDGDANGSDTAVADTNTPPGDACSCGTRECGTFNNCSCGTCDPGEACNAAGRCEVPGAALGAFCGLSATCTAENAADCMDDQCESKNCLSMNPAAVMLRDVCSRGCQIYKDSDQNGVNDADAAIEDCNPGDVVDGPAGNAFRCVNFAAPTSTPLGLCAPGSEFAECDADTDCPPGEGCGLTSIGGDYSFRCVANVKAGTWGAAAGMSEACNDDPASGPVAACESGLCFGLGCVTRCGADNDPTCDTTKVYADIGCDTTTHTCKGKASATCTTDQDCSSWTCGESRQIFGDGMGGLAGPFWRFCWPKSCAVDNDCGGGFYCRFFWNGELGAAAALDNSCLAQDPAGAELGEACDDEAGPTCKNGDLCLGGFCSALCATNDDCAQNQVCAVAELPGDTEPENADGTQGDGEYDFVLPIAWCEQHPRNATPCTSDAACGVDEFCEIYEIENRLGDGTLNPDGPYVLTGACRTADAAKANWGSSCESGTDCKSGFCLGATDTTAGYCTKTCGASSECEPVSLGAETANGACSSLLYAWGGDLDDPRVNVYVPLCLLDISSLADCAADFTCAATEEACLPNPISSGANVPGKVEYLCQALYDAAEPPTTLPTKAIGDACDLEATDFECAGGVCLEDKDGQGYCSGLCDPATDTTANNGTTCLAFTNLPRKGAYEVNAPSFNLWQKDQECTTCAGDWACPGDLVCANLGGNGVAAKYRCVTGCTELAECAAASVTTACSTTKDPFGDDVMGCFERGPSLPVNYCASL